MARGQLLSLILARQCQKVADPWSKSTIKTMINSLRHTTQNVIALLIMLVDFFTGIYHSIYFKTKCVRSKDGYISLPFADFDIL